MIVYGDTSRDEALEQGVGVLRLMLEQAQESEPRPPRIRGLVERAGELEQALFDDPAALAPSSGAAGALRARSRGLAAIRRVTSLAAQAFDRSCAGAYDEARAQLRAATEALRRLERARGTIRVRVPEGFAFYAVYLQSYRNQAAAWARDHAAAAGSPVRVVGIRTIGTSLSAVVAAALRARGFRAHRVTVRPTGHPFDRRVDLDLRPAPFGIVVDEGPGLSGSSMLAAAGALRRAGVGEVALFPAHDRGPGPRATDTGRARWNDLACYPASLLPPRYDGRSTADELWSGIEPAMGEKSRVTDIGAGLWRAVHYANPRAWPAAVTALERPKLLGASKDGARVLFRFSGYATAPGLERTLAAETARRAAPLAALGLAPRLFGEMHGWVAWEWIEGRPLGIQDASFPFLQRMGAYIAHAVLPALPERTLQDARGRVAAMLRANTTELLGEEAARVALAEFEGVRIDPGTAQAGDGRLAPYEWIGPRSGAALKTDVGGHDVDHAWTGAQPVVWDLAGALEEWDLHGAQADALLRGYQSAGGVAVAGATLQAYRTAYAAHRGGRSAFFAALESDPEERERLERDTARWRDQLTRCLAARAAEAPR